MSDYSMDGALILRESPTKAHSLTLIPHRQHYTLGKKAKRLNPYLQIEPLCWIWETPPPPETLSSVWSMAPYGFFCINHESLLKIYGHKNNSNTPHKLNPLFGNVWDFLKEKTPFQQNPWALGKSKTIPRTQIAPLQLDSHGRENV